MINKSDKLLVFFMFEKQILAYYFVIMQNLHNIMKTDMLIIIYMHIFIHTHIPFPPQSALIYKTLICDLI